MVAGDQRRAHHRCGDVAVFVHELVNCFTEYVQCVLGTLGVDDCCQSFFLDMFDVISLAADNPPLTCRFVNASLFCWGIRLPYV